MTTVTMREAKNRLTELARLVERGERVVVTRNGKPVLDLVPHRPSSGINVERLEDGLRQLGIERVVTWIADDFDDPLPEDVLLRPLPDGV